MASPEALNAIAGGIKIWRAYLLSTQDRPIDLTLANLRGRDLSNFSFDHCNLDGADLDFANLDSVSFVNCSLREASLENASLVACRVSGGDATGTSFKLAVLRKASLSEVELTGASFDRAVLEDCSLTQCRLARIRLSQAVMKTCALTHSKVTDLDATGLALEGCAFTNTTLEGVVLAQSIVADCRFESCEIRSCRHLEGRLVQSIFLQCDVSTWIIESAQVGNLDFTGSTLRAMVLESLDLRTATMLDVTVIGSSWPRQKGRTTFLGRYVTSPHLLRQPVQDLKGLTPILRREIADAQFLEERHLLATSLVSRISLRAWGATCAFGTSLTRLTLIASLTVLLIACGTITIDGWPHNLHDLALQCAREIAASAASLFGMLTESESQASLGRQTTLPIARLAGFLLLGLWIGIAANRLGRLSSE